MVAQQMDLREMLPENPSEALLLDVLAGSDEPRHVDELCRKSSLPVAEVSGTLVMLEMKGHVRQGEPLLYVRGRERQSVMGCSQRTWLAALLAGPSCWLRICGASGASGALSTARWKPGVR